MRAWWQQLSQREQTMVGLGSLSVMLILGYLFLYQPLNEYTANTRDQAQQQQALLHWMQQAQQQLKSLRTQSSQAQPINSAALLSTLSTALQTKPLKSFDSTLAQADKNRARIQFKQVPFDALIQFLTQLWRQYRITTVSLQTTPLATPGLVQASIVLKTSKP